MEKRLILMLGLPGSGKTTYVRNTLVPQGMQVVSPEAIRLAYGHSFYAPLEPIVHATALLQGRQHMLQGYSVVVDECNCRARHLAKWKHMAERLGYAASCIYMDTPKGVCIRRRLATPDFPLEVVERMNNDLSWDWLHIQSLFPDMITVQGKQENEDGKEEK